MLVMIHFSQVSKTYTACFITAITRSSPVIVLKKAVKNSTNTEGWLDDIWRIFARILNSCSFLDDKQVLANLNFAIANTFNVNSDLAVLLQVLG